ncbi:hypothetical protein P4S70_25915 [Enterovibrio sp. Hal110]
MSILTLRSRFLLIVSLALTGCMSGPAVKGSNVLVTPVNYVYKVDIKNKKLTPAKHELYAYLESNKYVLQVHGATIYWQGKEGKSLAVLARNWLLKQGTPSPKARVLREADGKGSSVKISTTVHQVQTPDCGYTIIGQYHHEKDGCSQDALRWQSMVYPERKLSGTQRLSFSAPSAQ